MSLRSLRDPFLASCLLPSAGLLRRVLADPFRRASMSFQSETPWHPLLLSCAAWRSVHPLRPSMEVCVITPGDDDVSER